MTKYADDPATENARKALEADKKVYEKSMSEYQARMRGKPTPTQEENDMAVLGAHILEHEPDGSDPDPNNQAIQGRSLEADKSKPQHYQTRQQTHKSDS
jgi:hypothetical protein